MERLSAVWDDEHRRTSVAPGGGVSDPADGGDAGRTRAIDSPPISTQVATRLDPEIFRLPVDRIREGYYSDAYFVLTKSLLEAEGHHPHVTMQVFQKEDSILGGIDEAIAVLKTCSGHAENGAWVNGWDQLKLHALKEGDRIAPRETVMTIEGDYSLFAHLETVYLGSMARRSLIMRNVAEVVEAARGKEIFYFPARHDHWLVQTGDGWSAHVAGAIGVSTDAQASWWGGRGVGTVPHGLIAAYGGDTVKAAAKFAERFHRDMNITVLVDFDNDSVDTALEVARALGSTLWGVRLDTSESLVDQSLLDEMGSFKPTGVNPRLVEKVRGALDGAGFPHVKIVVSGGFTAARIREFEAQNVAVDAYGVGSSLIRGDNDFTADIVLLEGRPCAKVGRTYAPNPRLERVQ
ncbi:MAG: quinolinate phosphoribosyl transferase [Solirubrobacteraceae bacterium]